MNEAASHTIRFGDGIAVRRIGFGAMKLTGDQVWGPYPDHDLGVQVLRNVVDAGVQLIDTADVYGPHVNEELIRDALFPYPDDLVIATKGGFVRGGFEYNTLSAVGNVNYLKQNAHMSAARLAVDTIDLYYLHSGLATDAPFEDQVGALADLRKQGLIRNIGLSNVTVPQLRLAQEITPIAAVTALFNLTNRTGHELLSAAEAGGLAFSPWHPVTLTDGPNSDAAARIVGDIARAHDATTQQVALAWQLQNSPVTLPIPGTTSPEHLRSNLAATELALDASEIRRLDALAAPAPAGTVQ